MSININRMQKTAGLFFCSLLLLVLGGCIGHIDRGHESSVSKYSASELDKKLVIGKTTKKEVLLLLGRLGYPEDYNHQKRMGLSLCNPGAGNICDCAGQLRPGYHPGADIR